MGLVEAGNVTLDTPVSTILPEFSGKRPIRAYEDPLQSGKMIVVQPPSQNTVEAASVTFRQLLTHSSGLPAWRPLFRQSHRKAAERMVFETFFSYMPDTQIVYSDIGLILLGFAIEKLTQLSLDDALQEYICLPLGLAQTTYRPLVGVMPHTNLAPTEFCRWRRCRILGEVHDENASYLGGISGHAGIFSTAADLAFFGQTFLSTYLLKADTISEMVAPQVASGGIRRGLGWLLPDEEGASPVGSAVGAKSYGHTGFTGTSLWIDPEKELVIVLLTNRVYYGRDAEKIAAFRTKLHGAILQ